MSEIYKLEYKRHVLRGVSGSMTVTAMKAMTMTAYQRMASSSWLAVDEQTSDLPPHKFNQTGHLDTYDAAKYCGDYANGKQKAYACAACYSIRLPEDARGDSPAKVEAIIASVYGDRWLAEGAVVSAFLSANESPPDWATIVDNTSSLASTPDPAPAIDEATTPDWQSPLRASVRSNAGPDHWYDAVITAAVPSSATTYLHIVIRLSDYISVPKITLPDATQKDSSWIEGGAAIDGATLQVQFDRVVTPDAAIEDPASADIAYPAAAALPIAAKFAAAPATITNPYLRLVYAARMLNGGRLADSATPTPTPETGPVITLSPSVRHVSGGVEARGIMVEVHAPRTLTAGRTMWLRSITAMQGASPARISVINSAAQPDADDPATWDGSAQNCIGSAVVSGVVAGQYIAIPITRDTTASRIWLVAAIADVRESDAAAPLVGWDTMQGIDLTNSLISRNRYLPSAAPTLSGWTAFAAGGMGGIIFPALLPGGAYPGDEDLYAISNTGSAAPGATSAGTWRQLSDDAYAAPMSVVRARDNSFVGLSATSGAICVSGDDSWLDPNIDRAALPTQNTDILSVLDGFLVVRAGAVNAFGAATTTAFGDTVSHWAGVSKIRGCFGTAFAVAIKTSGGVYAAGFSASAQSQLEALTNVVDVRISTSRLIAMFSDGSASAWEIAGTNIGSTALVTWSACYSIAATQGTVWAINDTGVVFSGPPSATKVYNALSIPAGATPTVIVGSPSFSLPRLAVAYMEV